MGEATINILKECAPIFATLQDESRQQILLLLFENREMTVNAIAEKMAISRPAVSHHLKQLLQTGVVSVRKVGKERRYSLSLDNSIRLLTALLTALEDDHAQLSNSA